jgi:hypothetical protein
MPNTGNIIPLSDEVHEHQCKVARCRHAAVYVQEDGTTVQGWCARCRCVAFGGEYEGLTYRDGRIIEVATGEPPDYDRELGE